MSLQSILTIFRVARLTKGPHAFARVFWKLFERQVASKVGILLAPEKLMLSFKGVCFSILLTDHLEDIWSIPSIFFKEEYRSPLTSARVIVDAGANIGLAAIYYSIIYPQAKIYCIEANPETFQRLYINTVQFSNIVLIHGALGRHDGETVFYKSTIALSSSSHRRHNSDISCRIPRVSFASLKSWYGFDHIDILKFDIEGGEEELCRDTTAIADATFIVGEVHLDLITMTRKDFLSLFTARTVSVEPLSPLRFLVRAL